MFLPHLCLVVAALCVSAEDPLKLVGAIELPNVAGRIDHMALVPGRERLWIAALENGTVEVVDLGTKKHERSLATTKRPTGVAYADALGLVLVASGADGRLDAYDAATCERRHSIEVGADADNVRWDAKHGRALVGCAESIAVVDLATTKVTRAPIGGAPESFQLDAAADFAFVNVASQGRVAKVDLTKLAVVAEWKLDGATRNYPMAIDHRFDVLLIGCREPAELRMFRCDAKGASALGDPTRIAGDIDDLWIDVALDRAYASCGEGFLDVLEMPGPAGREPGPRVYEPLARVPTAAGARTSLFDPKSRRLFLAVPKRDGQRCEIRIYATPATR